jgi:hypothetical protein
MNNQQSIVINGVLVGCNYWDVPVRVEVKAFLRFSRRMDNQLRRLVVRWAHAASPSARGVPAARETTENSVPPIS